uniref:Ig-like domain-containing protein n=1 Tax=Oreochromis aureus TaxID=47969 RepID=A0A668SAG6_OREAU
ANRAALMYQLSTIPDLRSSKDQMSDQGRTEMLECKMGSGFSMSSYTMFWYRQNHHRAPIEFLMREYEKPVGRLESFIDTSKNNFSLQITDTYYCAANHSDTHRPDTHTHNQRV